jgi:outer membrane protein assembly factor BamE (lipoprotein component of BamABCDE complex)
MRRADRWPHVRRHTVHAFGRRDQPAALPRNNVDFGERRAIFKLAIGTRTTAFQLMKRNRRLVRTTLRLALAAVLFALLPTVGSAQANDNLIVPGKRIGQAYIGMTLAELYKVLGRPSRTLNMGENIYYYYDSLMAETNGQTVWGLIATSKNFRTENGLKVGAQDLEVRALMGSPTCANASGGQTQLVYGAMSFLVNQDGLVTSIRVTPRPTCG